MRRQSVLFLLGMCCTATRALYMGNEEEENEEEEEEAGPGPWKTKIKTAD